MSKKLLVALGVIGVGAVGYYLYSKHQAAAASTALPSSTSPGAMPSTGASSPSAQAGSGGLYRYSADIDAVINRLDSATAAKYETLLGQVNAAQFQMLDSIAHAFNTNTPLTAEQSQFWATYGVF